MKKPWLLACLVLALSGSIIGAVLVLLARVGLLFSGPLTNTELLKLWRITSRHKFYYYPAH